MLSKLKLVLRILLGLLFLLTGLNKLYEFLPVPEMNEASSAFIGALINTGYMWSLVGLTEMVAGILLLANKWKGLALIFAAIISVNIVLFRIILDTNGIGIALFAAILNALLIYLNWSSFKSLFKITLNELPK